MKIRILNISEPSNESDAYSEAARIIRAGGLVAFPTETVYGLGANALDPCAAKKIYAAKGRPSDNPLIVHTAYPEDIFQYGFPDEAGLAEKICDAFMPGPITVVLKKKSMIPDEVTGGLDTVALRCPSDPSAHRFLEACGVPIAAPSANLSGKPSPTRASHVIHDLDGRIDAIICGPDSLIGLESTIVSVSAGTVKLLRPGFVTLEQLTDLCGHVEVDKAVTSKLADNERPLAPGMKYKHYAPSAPVTMVSGSDDAVIRCFNEALGRGEGVICYEEDKPALSRSRGRIAVMGSKSDPVSQAKALFDCLRSLDVEDLKAIYARFPSREGVGLAVFNRLIKACGFTVLDLGGKEC